MENSAWKYVVILLIGVIVVLVGSNYALDWFFGYREIPGLPSRVQAPSPSSQQPGETTALRVEKFDIQDGGFFYKVYGRFVEGPLYRGESLQGLFVIDGDSSETPVTVILTSRGGSMSLGFAAPTIDGGLTTQTATTDEVKDAVSLNEPVQLRLTYTQERATSEFEQRTIQTLDTIAGGSLVIPEDTVLVPQQLIVVK